MSHLESVPMVRSPAFGNQAAGTRVEKPAAIEHPSGRPCGRSCACVAKGGGGRHPALGRRLGVSGGVRSAGGAAASSAQGDDWSPTSQKRRTQGTAPHARGR